MISPSSRICQIMTVTEEIAAAGPGIRQADQTCLASPEFELYELRSDPQGMVNLAGKTEYQLLLEMILGHQRTQQEQTGDPLGHPKNVRFWLEEAERGRNLNYRGIEGFSWEYLEQFRPGAIRD